MNKTQDFTKGVIWKQLLFFFFPILIGSFFQQLYNTVDTIIVGQACGTNALAAVGSTGNLTNLVVNFYVGLSTGASVVIAQYYGAHNKDKIHQAVHTSYMLAIVSGIIMMLFGLFFSYQCLDAIGVPHDILNDASLYMRLYFLGMIPGAIYNIGSGILRAVGDSKRPLYYLIICSIVNVVFDFVLVVILAFKHGTKGMTSASSILIGIIVGYIIAAIMGVVLPTTGIDADGVEYTKAWVLNWDKVARASWISIPAIVPVKFVFDMRSLNVPRLEALKDSTIALIKEAVEAGGGQVEFDVVEGCPAVELNKDHECIKLAARAAETLGFPVELKTTGGCSDGNYLCGYGLPCGLLATGMSNVHTTAEYLKEEDLYNTARWTYEIIKEAAK